MSFQTFIRIKRISTGSHNCNIQVPGTGSQSLVIAILYAFSPFGLPENTALQPVFPRFPISTVDSIFANLEMARDMASELDEGKRAEYLKEYTDYQSYRIKAKEIAKEVLAKLK